MSIFPAQAEHKISSSADTNAQKSFWMETVSALKIFLYKKFTAGGNTPHGK